MLSSVPLKGKVEWRELLHNNNLLQCSASAGHDVHLIRFVRLVMTLSYTYTLTLTSKHKYFGSDFSSAVLFCAIALISCRKSHQHPFQSNAILTTLSCQQPLNLRTKK